MGRQIIKQSNGEYAIFSTIVDDFIMINVTIEKYIEFRILEESKQLTKDILKITDQLEKGERPYYQFTMTLKDAINRIREMHGDIRATELAELIGD